MNEPKRSEERIWGCKVHCPHDYNMCRLHNDECSYRNTSYSREEAEEIWKNAALAAREGK